MNRKPGYYWCKTSKRGVDEWVPVRWLPKYGQWEVIEKGEVVYVEDAYFVEIGDKAERG